MIRSQLPTMTDIRYIGGHFGPSIYDWTTVVGLVGQIVIYIGVQGEISNVKCDLTLIEEDLTTQVVNGELSAFIEKFKDEAREKMGVGTSFHAFTIGPGRTLTFAANRCYHAIYLRATDVQYILMHGMASF